MKKEIAFFDFDGTLINKDSFFLFGRYKKGNFKFLASIFIHFFQILLSFVGLKSKSKTKEHLFKSLYSNLDYEDFKTSCKEFSREIEKYTRKEIMEKAQNFQQNHIPTVIVSASPKDWIEPWAIKNGFTKVIATELEIKEDNKLSGRFSTPNCKGIEKVKRIKKEFPDLDEYYIYAYGDSRDDFPMLDIADFSSLV